MIKTERDDYSGVLMALIPATIVSIPDNPVLTRTKNENGELTLYYAVKARIEYADGTEDVVDSTLWKGSQDVQGYKEGDSVVLRTAIEGEYIGNSVVQLPAKTRVDVSKFDFAEATEPVPTTN